MICGRCGRKLKGTESIQRGYGPVCYNRMHPTVKSDKKHTDKQYAMDEIPYYDIPGKMELGDFIDMKG